jgi:hypothetical protein
MGKWFLRDWMSPQRLLIGTLTNVHNSGGLIHGGDNDTNLEIVPRDDFAGLLTNRHGDDNQAPSGQAAVVECEVNVGDDWRSQYESFVNSLVNHEVTAQGVYVDDDGHDSKTELHPMDAIFARVSDSQLPGDWIGGVEAELGLTLDQNLFVYRFAAASDQRAGLLLEGPPLAGWSRTTNIMLPLPPAPSGTGWAADYRVQIMQQGKATVDETPVTDPDSGAPAIELDINCQGVDYGGPGVAMGEIATFWTNQTIPVIEIAPTSISFGTVSVNEPTNQTLTITNTGHSNLVITIPPSASSDFRWTSVAGQVIAPGASYTVTVTFRTPATGQVNGQLTVESNTTGSPHIVTLSGSGKKAGGGNL